MKSKVEASLNAHPKNESSAAEDVVTCRVMVRNSHILNESDSEDEEVKIAYLVLSLFVKETPIRIKKYVDRIVKYYTYTEFQSHFGLTIYEMNNFYFPSDR
jgi:hypothetical protein